MRQSLRRSLQLTVVLLVGALGGTPALGAEVPGQSKTLLPDGHWLLAGGEGAAASAASILDERGETLETTPLYSGRRHHTATVLPDGRVLIFGGVDEAGALVETAEILDPSSRVSTPVEGPQPSPRWGHTANLLIDGRVLIVGGIVASGTPVGQMDLWSPSSSRIERIGAELETPRSGQSTTVLPSGQILISGGRDEKDLDVPNPELFNLGERSFASFGEAVSALQDLAASESRPEVAEVLPPDRAENVALDAPIAVRFTQPLRVGTLSPDSVTLLGPGDTNTPALLVAAEQGTLLFVTPKQHLFPGSTYTLLINKAADRKGNELPFFALGFETRALHGEPGIDPQDALGEDWVPGLEQRRGDWQTRRPRSPHQDLPPLSAPPGVTALAGQVLQLDGEPLANVALQIGDRTARSDRQGQFLLSDIPGGIQTLVIDGGTANQPGRTYGLFEARVFLTSGKTNVLPYTLWMPRINTHHAVKIESPTRREVVVTSPLIPGLELHIPAGVVLRDRAGRTVTEVSITPIPLDRPPFPLPTRDVPIYFTIQPGGVYLQSLDSAGAQGARLVYPNYQEKKPGTVFDFWSYDPVEQGWYVYGQGKVSESGKQVVPDEGVAIYEFTGAMVSLPGNAPPEGPPPGGSCDGDPVDCFTGLFLHTRTDLTIPGTLPLSLTRTYRPRDTASRAFGIGTNHLYDIFTVGDINPYTYQDLILPGGGRVHFQRTSPGTGFADAVYQHTSSPTEFHGAVITYFEGRWRLRMKDGAEMYFADCEGCSSARAAALREYRDRWGNEITLERDTRRNLTRLTSPDGRSITFTYDTSDRITTARDDSGRVVAYQYDGSGRLWKVINPEGGVEQYSYDTSHRMTSVKKPNGVVMVTNVYDTNGRVTRQTLSDGGVYQFAYTLDSTGRVTRTDVTNPRGIVRRMFFNSQGYLTSEVLAQGRPEQQTTTFQRSATTNLLSSVIDALGRRTNYTYDARGNVTSVTQLAGTTGAVTESVTYDPVFNQPTSITDALGHVIELRYDALGQLVELEDPLGNVARFSYTATGRLATVTDPLGKVTQLAYEGGDLLSATDPLGRTVTMFTDLVGRLLSLTDPLGNRYRYDYDRLDRVTRITDPLGAATTLTYDANSNLTRVTDAKGGVTSFAYDARDRVASITDPLLKVDSFLYDGMDNLTQATERNGKISTFVYDPLDRLQKAEFGRTQQGTVLTAPDATVTYTWDAGDRLTQAVDTQDGTIARGYDGLDRLVSETSPRGSVTYGYDAAGRRTRLSIPNQTDITYSYDDADRLARITQGTAQVGFTYDAAGRRTTLALPGGIVATYSYDAGDQLSGIVYTRSSTTIGDLAYQYDEAGRRVRESGSLARRTMPAAVPSASYNAANQLTAWGGTALTYDAKGNMTSDGSRTFTWDSRNRLKTIAGAATSSFGYDAFGRRSFRTVSGSTTGFLYDGLNIVQELAGSTVKANVLGGLGLDEVFRRTDAAGARNFLTDALGSTLVLADDTGVSRTQYRYEPYGQTVTSGDASSNSFQYTGRENDGTGLYYYRARYYSSGPARFSSEDPTGFEGGANLYSYAGMNPLSFIDPLGLFQCAKGANCDFKPEMKEAIECFDRCTGRDTLITGGVGNRSKPESSHARGYACDIGRNNNTDLGRPDTERCFEECFPSGFGQEEENAPEIGGTHFHIQYKALGSHRFAPGIKPYEP